MPRKGKTSVGAVVSRLRKESGLTQVEVAETVGITQPYLAHVESGRHEPSLVVLRDLARALGSSVDELLREGEGER